MFKEFNRENIEYALMGLLLVLAVVFIFLLNQDFNAAIDTCGTHPACP